MADFAPPSGPPPPKVPEGWKAIWNDQYNEWFYVNIHTKASTWEKPTEPAYGASMESAPSGGPPGYDHNSAQNVGPEKSNNPYLQQNHAGGSYGAPGGGYDSSAPNYGGAAGSYGGAPGGASMSEDERLARQLQEEESARSQQTGTRGASDNYYGGAPQYGGQNSAPDQLPPREGKKGLLGKLTSKLSSSGKPQQHYGGGGYPQHGYPQQGYPQQRMMGMGGGHYGQQPMYGQPMHGGYPGYGQQPMHYGHGQPQRRGGGGMGMAGGAAMGMGAGMLGGMMIGSAMSNDSYEDGYEDGQDDGGGDDGGGE